MTHAGYVALEAEINQLKTVERPSIIKLIAAKAPVTATAAATPPPKKRKPATTRYYVVQRGDSFSAIAAKARVSVAAIERLNPGVSSTALRVGQRIRVK